MAIVSKLHRTGQLKIAGELNETLPAIQGTLVSHYPFKGTLDQVSDIPQLGVGTGALTYYKLELTSAWTGGWHGIQEIDGYVGAVSQTLTGLRTSSATYISSNYETGIAIGGATSYGGDNAFDGNVGATSSGIQWLTPNNSTGVGNENYATYNPFYKPEWITFTSAVVLDELWVYNGRYSTGTQDNYKDYVLYASPDGVIWQEVASGQFLNESTFAAGNKIACNPHAYSADNVVLTNEYMCVETATTNQVTPNETAMALTVGSTTDLTFGGGWGNNWSSRFGANNYEMEVIHAGDSPLPGIDQALSIKTLGAGSGGFTYGNFGNTAGGVVCYAVWIKLYSGTFVWGDLNSGNRITINSGNAPIGEWFHIGSAARIGSAGGRHFYASGASYCELLTIEMYNEELKEFTFNNTPKGIGHLAIPVTLPSTVTLSFDFKINSWGTGYSVLINNDQNVQWFWIGAHTTTKHLYMHEAANGTHNSNSAVNLVPNLRQWYHLDVMWSGTTQTMYIDAVQMGASVTTVAATASANIPVLYFGYAPPDDYESSVMYKNFSIYNKVLSTAEMQKLTAGTLQITSSGDVHNIIEEIGPNLWPNALDLNTTYGVNGNGTFSSVVGEYHQLVFTGAGYYYKGNDIATATGEAYVFSGEFWRSADSTGNHDTCAIEGATSVTKAGDNWNTIPVETWTRTMGFCVADINVRFLVYPHAHATTSATGTYRWRNIQVRKIPTEAMKAHQGGTIDIGEIIEGL